MTSKGFLWLRSCHFPLLMLLGAAPLAVLLICIWDAALLPAAAVYGLAVVLVCMLCLALPGRRRVPVMAASCAAMLAACLIFLPAAKRITLLGLPLGASALLLAAVPLGTRRLQDVPPVLYVGGVISHLFTHFLWQTSLQQSPADVPIYNALTLLSIVYISLLLLAFNRISLSNATLGRHRATQSMHLINTLLTFAFVALSLFAASIPALAKLVSSARRLILSAFLRVVEFLLNLMPSAPYVGGGGGAAPGMPDMMMEEAEPALLAVILERIATYLSIVALIIGVILLVRAAVRGLVFLSRRLAARMRRHLSSATEDYIDEISDTRTDSAQRSSIRIRRAARGREPADSPAARIRLRYARLLGKHPAWHDSSTARENLPGDAASLYERARYSTHPVAQEDAEQFNESVRRL